MEISKAPPADAASVRTGVPAPGDRGSQAAAQQPAPPVAPPGDLADIRPLDVSAALQILLAEVRAGLDAMLQTAIAQSPAAVAAASQSPLQAARTLVEMYLKALPADAGDAEAWTAAFVRVDDAMQSSFERAAAVVAQWRDASPPVMNAARETLAWFVAALRDDADNPLWLRPEWLGLAPAFNRFRRRRRNARRRLADPDYPWGSLDDDSGASR